MLRETIEVIWTISDERRLHISGECTLDVEDIRLLHGSLLNQKCSIRVPLLEGILTQRIPHRSTAKTLHRVFA